LPIYMGAPNIDDWVPGDMSIIKTDDFSSPKDLAKYLQFLLDNPAEYDKYFEWKKHPLAPKFVDKYEKCVFYGAECRLCEALVERRKQLTEKGIIKERKGYGENPDNTHRGYALEFDGSVSVVVPSSPSLSAVFRKDFTIAAWVYFDRPELGMRIVDKNSAGTIDGVTFDLQPRRVKSSNQVHSFLRLCVANRCFVGTRPIHAREWYYVAVTFQYGDVGVSFVINGMHDISYPIYLPARENNLPIVFGKASSGTTTESLYGKLDDVSIWSIVLTPEELKKNAFRRFAGDELGLEGYWPMNEATGTEVGDVSIHQRHGTVSGNFRWVDAQTKPLALAGCW